MNKNVTVRIPVNEPILSYEKDTQWQLLEKYAGNCPVPHYSTGYCFNNPTETSFSRPYRDYGYHSLSEEDAEKIRIYWTQTTMEIGISPDDIEVEIWDSSEEWPIFNSDEIEVRGIE